MKENENFGETVKKVGIYLSGIVKNAVSELQSFQSKSLTGYNPPYAVNGFDNGLQESVNNWNRANMSPTLKI